MPAALKGRDEVLQLITGVFRRHGYDGATLALLSEATGLVKASLYHHFPNGKQDMAHAVLARLGELSKNEVLDKINSAGDPHVELVALCERLGQYFQNGQVSCILEVFSLGQARDLFKDEISARMQRLASAFARLLQLAGLAPALADERGWEAVAQIEGALVVARATSNPAYFVHMMKGLPSRLMQR